MLKGVIAGMCIGGAMIAILWNEPWDWRLYIRYQIAAVLMVVAMNLMAGG